MVSAAAIYYRAGYTPDDYPTPTEWEGRRLVEHSGSVKSPDVFYHLFGSKKIQQVLARPEELRRFVKDDAVRERLASTFAGLYALGEGDDSEIVERAMREPSDFVLKPQREGGGNNLYDDELVRALGGGWVIFRSFLKIIF